MNILFKGLYIGLLFSFILRINDNLFFPINNDNNIHYLVNSYYYDINYPIDEDIINNNIFYNTFL